MFMWHQVCRLRLVALAALFAGLLVADSGASLGQPDEPKSEKKEKHKEKHKGEKHKEEKKEGKHKDKGGEHKDAGDGKARGKHGGKSEGHAEARGEHGPAGAAPVTTAAKVKEAEELKAAYIRMALANHDYDGHRAKAMGHIHQAIEALDASVLRHGANGQKVVALEDEIATARAKHVANAQAKVHEPQAWSNFHMREAGHILASVHTALAGHKQPAIREHVAHAIKQVEAALAVR